MAELIFATGNAHKVKETSAVLSLDGVGIKSLKDIGYHEDIPETGDSLHENAAIKARTIHAHTGQSVFSEDTGLEVMALDMAPGIYSARYAGPERDAEANMSKLLEALRDHQDRTARFRTVICLIWEGQEYYFEGLVNGLIATSARGEGGFGYDPVFVPFGFTASFAELSAAIKNGISHRYRAMMGMKRFFDDRG